MTIGQRIFYLLDEKHMTQKEFSDRTGIATTTISDWRKKNTNPGSDKIMTICAALDITPEYLLAGVTEDSERGRQVDYMVIPKGTQERELIEIFNGMEWLDRENLLEYARKVSERSAENKTILAEHSENMTKIAEFCNIEMYIDSDFQGEPELAVNYLDDNVVGTANFVNGNIVGDFSKYVRPVIEEWLKDNRGALLNMWNSKKIELLPAWE